MQIFYKSGHLVLKYRKFVVKKCFNIFVFLWHFFFSSFFIEQQPFITTLDYLLIIERLFDSINHIRSMLSLDLH